MIASDFEGYINGAFKANGPIFATILARQMVFSEITFGYRDRIRKDDLFGSSNLSVLERPWPGATTGDVLARMEQDASIAGNSFWVRADNRGRGGNSASGDGLRLARLRPDWVTLILGSFSGDPFAFDSHVIGILYSTRLTGSVGNSVIKAPDQLFLPEEVAHYAPIPDPAARFRGMSWLTPILTEIQSDIAASIHKKKFFEHAAVPNLVIKFDKDTNKDDFNEFVEKYKSKHQGAWNAYKTLFLLGGADVTPVTMDFRQLDFAQTVGKSESRIASAGGVPQSWLGFSEGMQGSGLNAGNFAAARRRFADGTIRPAWRIASAALESVAPPPNNGSQLWYDERDVAFLREDWTDLARITQIEMTAIDSGIKSGFEPDAVVAAVKNRDLSKLVGQHTGFVSVQMQPPVDPNAPAPNAISPAPGPNGD